MSFVRIWVHLVFSTRNREQIIRKDFRQGLYSHIIENCREKEIFLQAVSGYSDHIHCLVSLGRDQTIAKVAQLIKGESARWINENELIEGVFNWQDDYLAISVSESQVKTVSSYIKNQEAHHLRKSFDDEAAIFAIRYGFQKIITKE